MSRTSLYLGGSPLNTTRTGGEWPEDRRKRKENVHVPRRRVLKKKERSPPAYERKLTIIMEGLGERAAAGVRGAQKKRFV